jgi:subtilisin family serine protease
MCFPKFFCGVLAFFPAVLILAQRPVTPGWHLLDKATEGYQGISAAKAHQFLSSKTPSTVIVAVLDGGVDTTHAALKHLFWNNPHEIAFNGKDDDGNGYTDDVFGWNFLGNANGTNVEKETAEVIRLYHKLKPSFEGKAIDLSQAPAVSSSQYHLWLKVNKQLEVKPEDQFTLKLLQASTKAMNVYDSVVQTQCGKPEYSIAALEDFVPQNPDGKKAKYSLLRFVDLLQIDHDRTNKEILNDVTDYIERQQSLLLARDQDLVNYRYNITGDDEEDIDKRHYGNADVMGQGSLHGTHVSGIIAGVVNADTSQNASSPLRVLPVRMVPRGDEHDKDVALGIRYAVDNGAKVINMSFGKELSPYKHWVDDAIKYAAAHDVLIVHAAGNDAENMDSIENYPSARYDDNSYAANMITVGASGDSSLKCGLVADFTNFGSQMVDVLAPGVKIYSTVPGGYAYEQGTSMAAPVVSGIAALIRAYYPSLSAVQVRHIIEQSADDTYVDALVPCPGSSAKDKRTTVGHLCKTGGIANAYRAVLLADRTWQAQAQSGSKTKAAAKKG